MASPFRALVEYQRAGLSENIFFGAYVVLKNGRFLYSVGDDPYVFARSLMKPFYTETFCAALDFLSLQQKAVALSSHNGSPRHVEMVWSFLKPAQRKFLKTPASGPLMKEPLSAGSRTAKASLRQASKNKWVHNSSGHHAGILRGLLEMRKEPEGYTQARHFVYRSLIKNLKARGVSTSKIYKRGVDGDGLPTLALRLSEIAKLYTSLSLERDKNWIWEAFTQEPYFIGGLGRLDSLIMESSKGQVLAKEGAEGLLAFSFKKKVKEGAKALRVRSHMQASGKQFKEDHYAVVLKLAHGWDTQVGQFIAAEILKNFGFKMRVPKAPLGQKVVVRAFGS